MLWPIKILGSDFHEVYSTLNQGTMVIDGQEVFVFP